MANGLGSEVLWACPTISQSASDLSGNGYDGSMMNGASIVSDRDNNNGTHAFFLDGADDTIAFSYISSMNQVSKFSVSLWAYRESSSFDYYLLKGSASARTPYIRSLYDGSIEATLDLSDGSSTYRQTLTGYGAGIYDEWIHLALTWSGTKTILYANGAEISSTTNESGLTTKTDGGRMFKIGPVNGKVDDMRVFNTDLTPDQIRHLVSHRGVENEEAVALIDWLI